MQKCERRAKIVEAIRKAVLQIKAKGQFPSLWRVKKELPNDNWMAEKRVRVEWKRIAPEEGFVFRNPMHIQTVVCRLAVFPYPMEP